MTNPPVTQRRIINMWWPLAASWLLMSFEGPIQNAVVARLPDPEIHLAAYGGVVFPLALIIEAPIVMLLTASTALSKDWPSYRTVWKYMMSASAVLTALHMLVALTPLYDFLVRGLMGIPDEVAGPARIGMIIMIPWTWSIAYRRFQQGVLIRFGHSRHVSIGTGIRLASDVTVLLIGYSLGSLPGIVVATSAVAVGVIAEATYIGIVVRPVLKYELKPAAHIAEPLTNKAFAAFYFPLVLTPLLSFLAQPIGSAALSRMPRPVESLATWSAVSGLLFLMRSLGIAYNEVVVALLEEPEAYKPLRRFALILMIAPSLLLLIYAATPLADFWFSRLTSLSPQLANLAVQALWLALPLPGIAAAQSWFQGQILHSRKTRPISESVVIYLASISLVLLAGIAWGKTPGLYVGVLAMSISTVIQTAWLWFRTPKHITP